MIYFQDFNFISTFPLGKYLTQYPYISMIFGTFTTLDFMDMYLLTGEAHCHLFIRATEHGC